MIASSEPVDRKLSEENIPVSEAGRNGKSSSFFRTSFGTSRDQVATHRVQGPLARLASWTTPGGTGPIGSWEPGWPAVMAGGPWLAIRCRAAGYWYATGPWSTVSAALRSPPTAATSAWARRSTGYRVQGLRPRPGPGYAVVASLRSPPTAGTAAAGVVQRPPRCFSASLSDTRRRPRIDDRHRRHDGKPGC